jgi:Tol biopolymer transport system component
LPDGRLLYGDWTQPGELDIFLEDSRGNRSLLTKGGTPKVSRDGRSVYLSVERPGKTRAIEVVDVSGGPPRLLTNETGCFDDWASPTPGERHVVFVRRDAGGKESLRVVEIATKAVQLLFEDDVTQPAASDETAVFRTCQGDGRCGVYVTPLAGGTARLLIPGGWYPAFSRDGRLVYAWAGQKNDPHLVVATVDGSSPPRRLFEFNADRVAQFWAIQTMVVSPDGRSLVTTHQWMNDDIMLLEGVFR